MGAVVVETTEIPKKPSIEFEAKEVTTIPISFFYHMKKLKCFQLADNSRALPIYFYIQILTPIPSTLHPHCAFPTHLSNFFREGDII